MTARRAITLATKVQVLLQQALCPKCGQRLGSDVEWNHVQEHALGGSDGPENIEAVHKVCHKIITVGTGATTAGSSVGKVAKVKRLQKKNEGRAAHDSLRMAPSTEPSRAREGGSPKRKIQSPGFQKPPPGFVHFPAGRKVGA